MIENDAHAFTHALWRAARVVAHRQSGGPASIARTRDTRRVLLVAPPSSPGNNRSADGAPPDLALEAESLRAAGFRAEVYDATSCAVGASSIRAHIEHAYPQVVAVAAFGATESARDVLRAAKEVVPGVFTVLLGSQSPASAVEASRDRWADCVVDTEGAETLPGLLVRLIVGEHPKEETGTTAIAS